MKKTLLSLFILAEIALSAQTQSPDWAIVQNTNFPQIAGGVRYMDAVSANVVWATGYDGFAGGRNYNWFTTTSDGGNTFVCSDVFADTNTYVISAIEGISASTAYVTAYFKATGIKGVVYKTTDAGASWANVAAANMYTAATSFANITCFTDSMTGITMGDPVGGEFEIHRTIDGGTTWTQIPGTAIPNQLNATEYGFTGVYTKLGNNIWFGTSKGRVFHSADAGATWTVGAIPGASLGVSRLAFRDNMNGLSIAYSGTSANLITGLYKTTDGGLTWVQLSISAAFGRNDICAISGTNMYASCGAGPGNEIISYSTDDGLSWIDWGSIGIQYLRIDFFDSMNGWVGSFSDQSLSSIGGMYKYSGSPTSLAPFAEKISLSITPNPSSGIINMNLPSAKKGLTIEVIDALGKVVYSEKITSTSVNELKQLNLSHLSKGLYTVNFITDADKSFSKIVLQ